MISFKSIKKFVMINTVLSTIGYIKYHYNYLFINEIVSIWFLYYFMNDIDKPYIKNNEQPVEKYFGEFYRYIALSCLIKTITHKIALQFVIPTIGNTLITFIPISFAFEIIFDLFHWFFHRLSHSNHFLYRYHKIHHTFNNPNIWTSFYMHPVDSILSYSIPFLLTMIILPLSELEMWLITIYLSYQELAGHLGKKMRPTSCFPQCIWIPKLFHIELYTEDHHLHHSTSNCNYSKRFNLWDKAWGTFRKS